MASSQQLTPRGAVWAGLGCIVCGMFPILVGAGIITPDPGPGLPRRGCLYAPA